VSINRRKLYFASRAEIDFIVVPDPCRLAILAIIALRSMSDWRLEALPYAEFRDHALICRIGIDSIEGLPRWLAGFHPKGPSR
jgi:hypothetical protein